MPNSPKDIDSILESIKKRKMERGIVDSSISSEKKLDLDTPEIKQEVKQEIKQEIKIEKEDEKINFSDDFLKFDNKKEEISPNDKPTELEDKFKDFFTITVAVTKTPEEIEVKSAKKKSGFFKKKYITDSLSLNLPDEYFFEDNNEDKKSIKKKRKEQKLEAIKLKETQEKLQNTKEEIIITAKKELETPIIESTEDFIMKSPIVEKAEISIVSPVEVLAPVLVANNPAPEISPREKKKLNKKRIGFKSLFSLSDDDIEDILNEEKQHPDTIYKKDSEVNIKTELPIYKKYKDEYFEKEEVKTFISEDIQKQNLEDLNENLEIKPYKEEVVNEIEIEKIEAPIITKEKQHITKTQIVLNNIIGEEKNIDNEEKTKEPDITNENKEELELSNTAENVFNALSNQDTQDVFLTKFVETDTLASLEIEEEETQIKEDFFKMDSSIEDEESVFEEYVSAGEIFENQIDEDIDIISELQSFKTTLSFRILAGMVGAVLLSMLTIFATSSINLPSFINPISQPMMFYIVNLVILLAVLIAFLPTIISGFRGLFNQPTPDSFISLGCVLTVLQLILFTFNSSSQPPNEMTIFASIVCFALAFNAIGKTIATDNIIRNLKLAYAPEGINVGYILKDTEALKRISRVLDSNMPNILISRKTSNITNFLQAGFSISKSDVVAKKTVLISYIVTAISFVLAFFVSKDFLTAFSCATGAAVLQIPLAHSMIVSVPSSLMQKKLKQVGALVNGWQGIDQLSKTTHVTFDAKHLFTKDSIVLQGIRPTKIDKLDAAILYASSVLIAECENLKPIFMQVIKNDTDILYPVESCEYTQNQGYVAWVNKSRVLVGNRQLMEKYDIQIPAISGEVSLGEKNQKPIYVSVNGQLYGVFVVSYHRDNEVKQNLDVFVKHSRNIILTSRDFNVDARLVEKIYDLPYESVGVLNQQEFLLMQSFTDYTFETEACVAHLDNLHSLTQSFSASEAARIAQTICLVVQNLSVATGSILALLFSYSLTIPKIPLLSIQLIALGFTALTLATAYIKKY